MWRRLWDKTLVSLSLTAFGIPELTGGLQELKCRFSYDQ
jgi:hypothetical protein